MSEECLLINGETKLYWNSPDPLSNISNIMKIDALHTGSSIILPDPLEGPAEYKALIIHEGKIPFDIYEYGDNHLLVKTLSGGESTTIEFHNKIVKSI